MFFSMLLMQLPTLGVGLTGVFLVLARRKSDTNTSFWALMGFGLSSALCVIIPATQTWVQLEVMQGGASSFEHRASNLMAFSLLWSILHAATYFFLLLSVLAGLNAENPFPRTGNDSQRTPSTNL